MAICLQHINVEPNTCVSRFSRLLRPFNPDSSTMLEYVRIVRRYRIQRTYYRLSAFKACFRAASRREWVMSDESMSAWAWVPLPCGWDGMSPPYLQMRAYQFSHITQCSCRPPSLDQNVSFNSWCCFPWHSDESKLCIHLQTVWNSYPLHFVLAAKEMKRWHGGLSAWTCIFQFAQRIFQCHSWCKGNGFFSDCTSDSFEWATNAAAEYCFLCSVHKENMFLSPCLSLPSGVQMDVVVRGHFSRTFEQIFRAAEVDFHDWCTRRRSDVDAYEANLHFTLKWTLWMCGYYQCKWSGLSLSCQQQQFVTCIALLHDVAWGFGVLTFAVLNNSSGYGAAHLEHGVVLGNFRLTAVLFVLVVFKKNWDVS
jgi:hypothetical protein